MEFPKLYLVRQNFPKRTLSDIPGTVERELSRAGFAAGVKPNANIAIGVGSRGISNIDVIAGAIVRFWKNAGANPFIFPAMGSHGAASAEGQAKVLAKYGITEETMGCPIKSSLDVVPLEQTEDGIQTYMDQNAFESDGVVLCGRVKWHTDFAGELESGLFKMMAIGLGKFAGAQRYHTYGYSRGLENVFPQIGRAVLKSGKILGGLAILEGAYHETAQLTAVRADEMEEKEKELLRLVKSWMPKLPADLDLLIVDEMGKNISGAGMDTKIINRSVYGEYNPWPNTPQVQRIFVRDLSNLSYGNAAGIGIADIVCDRLVNKVDWAPTFINVNTSSTPPAGRTPVHLPTDLQCLKWIATTVGKFDTTQLRIGWIRHTNDLTPLVLSDTLRAEIEANPLLEILEGPFDFSFDAEGQLIPAAAEALAH